MGPEYTTCVEEGDFSELNPYYITVLLVIIGVGGFAAAITGGLAGPIAAAAFFEALRYVLDWLLHGKLICLHRNSVDCNCGGPDNITCAIGEIVDTEEVGEDKNPIQDLDDDYGINLALFPFSMRAFAAKGFIEDGESGFNAFKQSLFQIATMTGQPQGDLVTRSVSVHGKADEFGYLRTMVMLNNGEYHPWTEIVGRDSGTPLLGPNEGQRWRDYILDHAWLRPEKYCAPVLHCEFEGSRTRDMLAALDGFPFGSSFCKSNWFTKLLCKIIAAVLAPIVLIALALAWARNTEGSVAPALEGGGTIGARDRVIVRGSWRYDAGHEGWNEIHAVRIVQRVENVPLDALTFKVFLHEWCDRLGETPLQGATSQPTPAATATLTAQSQPENQWTFHPSVDGCQSSAAPPGLH